MFPLSLSYLESDTVAHIKLIKFGADTDTEWEKVVNEVTNHNHRS